MDPMILFTYRKFQENLQMRNTIAGGLGQQILKPCGIPQGCPPSMKFIALIMLPWLKTVKAKGATPRILADNILTLASGKRHLPVFVDVLNFTHAYIGHMGSALAPEKNHLMTKDLAAQKWLTNHIWGHTGTRIAIVTNCRDVGAHIW